MIENAPNECLEVRWPSVSHSLFKRRRQPSTRVVVTLTGAALNMTKVGQARQRAVAFCHVVLQHVAQWVS